ncbi:MAG: hypothetical protein M5U28_18780 [Sandaracinaceae bacterium]|nr:hypothetical protein [Sandaracinaceae bacterium]
MRRRAVARRARRLRGRVLCVDAIALLVVEARPAAITPVAGDPSPQPNRPPPPEVGTTTTIAP